MTKLHRAPVLRVVRWRSFGMLLVVGSAGHFRQALQPARIALLHGPTSDPVVRRVPVAELDASRAGISSGVARLSFTLVSLPLDPGWATVARGPASR